MSGFVQLPNDTIKTEEQDPLPLSLYEERNLLVFQEILKELKKNNEYLKNFFSGDVL